LTNVIGKKFPFEERDKNEKSNSIVHFRKQRDKTIYGQVDLFPKTLKQREETFDQALLEEKPRETIEANDDTKRSYQI
jgi:hypothetical protein